MTPIVIATDLGPQDWRELAAYIGRHNSPRARQFGWVVGALATVAAIIAIQFVVGSDHALALGLGAMGTALAFAIAQRFYLRRSSVTKNRVFFGPLRIELDQHGIRTIRAGFTSAVDWNVIDQVDETATAVFLRIDSTAAFMIPKRSVDPVLLPDLIAQLRAWHAERTRTSLSEPAPGFEPPSSVALTRDVTLSTPPTRAGFFRALAGNLRAGFKLLTFRRVGPTDITVS